MNLRSFESLANKGQQKRYGQLNSIYKISAYKEKNSTDKLSLDLIQTQQLEASVALSGTIQVLSQASTSPTNKQSQKLQKLKTKRHPTIGKNQDLSNSTDLKIDLSSFGYLCRDLDDFDMIPRYTIDPTTVNYSMLLVKAMNQLLIQE